MIIKHTIGFELRSRDSNPTPVTIRQRTLVDVLNDRLCVVFIISNNVIKASSYPNHIYIRKIFST